MAEVDPSHTGGALIAASKVNVIRNSRPVLMLLSFRLESHSRIQLFNTACITVCTGNAISVRTTDPLSRFSRKMKCGWRYSSRMGWPSTFPSSVRTCGSSISIAGLDFGAGVAGRVAPTL